jgi:hypothetical protein
MDQFSFLQSEDRYLNVLVRAEAMGDGMWAAEVAEGDVAFIRIPLSSFSDGSRMVPATSYQQLPKPEGDYFQNRFVHDYLLYGTGRNARPLFLRGRAFALPGYELVEGKLEQGRMIELRRISYAPQVRQ